MVDKAGDGMSKQLIIGLLVIMSWLVLGGLEKITFNETIFGLLGFIIGAYLIIWESK